MNTESNSENIVPTAVILSPTPVMSEATSAKITKARRMKYGTGLLVKRVVLANGAPIGRGRPNRGVKKSYVYIPVKATYDVEVYGTGSPFKKGRADVAIKTVKREQFMAKYPKAVIG